MLSQKNTKNKQDLMQNRLENYLPIPYFCNKVTKAKSGSETK